MTTVSGTGTLRLATRGSLLARAQASLAVAALTAPEGLTVELVVVSTGGDRDQTTPIAQMEGQGWFTGEIERTLLEGRADVAVHSAKDLPTELAAGLAVMALLPRADPRDAVVSRDGHTLGSLQPGARVASSSARRAALLEALRPDLSCVPIRGNVDSRLRRLDEGEFDALLLAAAGLDRLGLGGRVAERLDPRSFVPAPAQGAIALEVVAGEATAAIVAKVDDPPTSLAVSVERAVLVALGGGCLLPLGVWARLEGGALVVSAALHAGGALRRAERGGDPTRPAALADEIASALR